MPQRKDLGRTKANGSTWGIYLSPVAEFMLVGEGIETTLSAMQMFGLPGIACGVAHWLGVLELPRAVRRAGLLADRDEHGAGERETRRAMWRWRKEGRKGDRFWPPEGFKDFNDVLTGGSNGGETTKPV